VHEEGQLSPRARQIVDTARAILEREGRDALTLRRLASELGIRAPSLYKHFPDKAPVEVAVIENGVAEWAAALESEVHQSTDPVVALGRAYRTFALSHPHLYRLMTAGQLPRERMRAGVEQRAAALVLHVFRNAGLVRAARAFSHGMTTLELDGRFPPDADLDAAWDAGLTALADQIEPAAFALLDEAG
jgi:AcrR family transcriptional regulator